MSRRDAASKETGHSAEQAIIDARRAKAERAARARREPVRERRRARAGGRTLDVAAVRALADGGRDAAGKYDEEKVEALAGGARAPRARARRRAPLDRRALVPAPARSHRRDPAPRRARPTLGADYARLDDIDVGDIVEAEGHAHGEQARRALDRADAPAPAHEGATARCPRSGTGSRTSRSRYRQRYVDLVANPRGRRRLPRAQPHRARAARDPRRRAASSRSRRRRCTRSSAAPRRAPSTTHHNALDMRPLHAHRAGALLEAPRRRRPRARLRDRPLLPQRGHLARGTTPSSRCSSSTRRTRRTTT